MMKTTKKLTFEQHEEIGAELQRIRRFMIGLAVNIPGIYGKTKRVSKSSVKAFRDIDSLRNVMEEQLFIDHPEQANTKIYYGAALPNHTSNNKSASRATRGKPAHGATTSPN
ncbi:MAG: hypothetical protein RLZZ214_3408 [Verrucomicrobiota bacterium]|jgi:hypothetical protein